MRKRKMLLIVPHQDDEMLIGGGVLYQFAHSKEWESYVLYTTEGAAVQESSEMRMKEGIVALKRIGIPEKHIIFLGYGNGWRGDKHIYHADGNEELVSLKGDKETFALSSHGEYCYEKYKIHHTFTRNNYKNDLLEVISDIKPDVMIAVDLDDHEEHMATSFLIDECLEEILKKEENYTPLLLKKFAYDGLWHGNDDYFNIPRLPTLNGEGRKNDTRNPIFQWDERIRFANPPQCDTWFFCNNRLNKAIKAHKSQGGWLCAARLINSDNVFWIKRTDNLALKAKIDVSSGNAFFLNDFKMVDAIDVRNKNTVWGKCSWIPQKDDKERKIVVKWKEKQGIKEIILYETPENLNGKIKNVRIKLDDGYEFETGELQHNGVINRYDIKEKHFCSQIEITLLEMEGVSGLSEIEIFCNTFNLNHFSIPVSLWEIKQTKYVVLKKLINHIEKKIFYLKARILLR